ncbi:MAG: hypothetical protein EBU72_13975 [Betaproteobacteria bacterium]|nr:hypothetical protein [Betaproteobacteria bacterium]
MQRGLESANKVGVKAAKLTFWAKLAGAAVTGLGLIAFGVFTGGMGPLAVAGLSLMGAYFLKACGDVHLARLQLANAKALAAGSAKPPHELPCGADSLAHLLFYPMRQWCLRKVDPSDAQGKELAQQRAIQCAKVTSLGLELTLGIAATAVTGAGYHMMAESLGFLAGRLFASFCVGLVMREPSKEHQLASIAQARHDLAFVDGQLQALRVDPPEPDAPPEQVYLYQDQSTQLASLKHRFAQVRERFEEKLKSFEHGLESPNTGGQREVRDARMAIAEVAMDVAESGMFIEVDRDVPMVTLMALGFTVHQAKAGLTEANRQEGLMERFTKACLEMNQNLKALSKEAFEFKTVLGMPPVEWPVTES